MEIVNCVFVDDDIEEHEIFLMAMEGNYDCSACCCATGIFQADDLFKANQLPSPEFVFVDWSVIRADPKANIDLLKSIFPEAADRIVILTGEMPLVDMERLGIASVMTKKSSISEYGDMLKKTIQPHLRTARRAGFATA